MYLVRIVSKLFENCRFKISTDILPGTGSKNGKRGDLNTNENMDNVLTRNEYLNDKKLIVFKY